MSVISMKALLESGVHFGHRPHKWNPRMKPYIFTERNGIHIIDLQKTAKAIDQAFSLIRDIVAEQGVVLFVGTKRQAQETIQLEATRVGMPYVTNRWSGGMLTNWRTIRERVNELERLESMRDSGDFERITKKEGLIITRKIDRLEMLLGGIRNMAKPPDIVFVVDVQREATAIHEANLLKIPVVAMVDTNCDPRSIDYVIPSNDDAIRAIRLIVGKMADAVVEGKALRKDDELEDDTYRSQAQSAAEETELSDEELLGEATLAKISQQSDAEQPIAGEAQDGGPEAEVAEVGDETEATQDVEQLAVVEAHEESIEAEVADAGDETEVTQDSEQVAEDDASEDDASEDDASEDEIASKEE